MRALRRLFEAIRTAVSDLLRRPLFSLLSVLAVAVALSLLAAFVMLSRGARDLFHEMASQSAVEVYLRPGATPEAVEELERTVKSHRASGKVERISSEQALGEFVRLYPDLQDVKDLLGENPLPGSLRITPHTADLAAVTDLVRSVRGLPAALSVRYDREWLEALGRLGEALRLFGLAGAAVLLLAALVTVGAVVRLALDDKIDEVTLLRLVGAPASFVLGPVLMAGGILGGLGAGIALAGVGLGRGVLVSWAAATPLGPFVSAAFGHPPPLFPGLALLLAGFLVGAASAGIASGKASLR